MSDQNDMLKLLYENNARLKQTETREVPGNIPGFSQFYDTGTYVPTYTGGTTAGVTTYSLQVGQWVRIGVLVTASAIVLWSAATGTGEARISLPFTSGAGAGFAFGSLFTDSVTIGAYTPYVIVSPSNAYLRLFTPANNAGSTVVAIEAAGDIRFTVSYRVD